MARAALGIDDGLNETRIQQGVGTVYVGSDRRRLATLGDREPAAVRGGAVLVLVATVDLAAWGELRFGEGRVRGDALEL